MLCKLCLDWFLVHNIILNGEQIDCWFIDWYWWNSFVMGIPTTSFYHQMIDDSYLELTNDNAHTFDLWVTGKDVKMNENQIFVFYRFLLYFIVWFFISGWYDVNRPHLYWWKSIWTDGWAWAYMKIWDDIKLLFYDLSIWFIKDF